MKKGDGALSIAGVKLTGSGRRWEITGPGPNAYNEPGKAPNVTIKETSVSGVSDKLTVAPCSVTLVALTVK